MPNAEIKITGHLGKDPELRFTANGSPVLGFNIAASKSRLVNEQWETVSTTWYRVSLWGSAGEYYAERLRKGLAVTVWGEVQEREYTNREGTTGKSLEVEAHGLRIIPAKTDHTGQPTPPRQSAAPRNQAAGNAWEPTSEPPF